MTDETATKALTPPGPMGRARAPEKVRVHYGGDASLLLDLTRSALIVHSLDELNAALDNIKSTYKIVRIKDHIAEPTEMGYRDIALNVQMSSAYKGSGLASCIGRGVAHEDPGQLYQFPPDRLDCREDVRQFSRRDFRGK